MSGPPWPRSRRSLSKPDRGIIKTVIEAVNSDGQTVMRATGINFVLVRPAPVRDMLYAFGFERVGVVLGDLYFVNPRAAQGQEGAEHGVRLELRMLDRGAPKGSAYSAQPIEIGQPVWRADLLESVEGPPGSFDRTHHHPAFAGWEPGRRVYVTEMSDDPLGWLGACLADLDGLLASAGFPAEAAARRRGEPARRRARDRGGDRQAAREGALWASSATRRGTSHRIVVRAGWL